MSIKVGVNGFGRIGRAVIKLLLDKEGVDLVAINSTRDPDLLCHLLKYDSLYGIWEKEVKPGEKAIYVDGKEIKILGERNPEKLEWDSLDIDVVVEATGQFRERDEASKHLGGSVKKVLITAPGKNEDLMIVMGVNEEDYDPNKHHVVSNASCTTNCVAPLVKVLNDQFGVKEAMMTTIHAYTNDQVLLDNSHKDKRRARAASMSIIPTTTGAAQAVSKVIPSLDGRIDGISFRVPTPTVSTVDLVATLEKDVSEEEINKAFDEAARTSMKGILDYNEEPLVSIDYTGNHHSAIVDADSTMKVGKEMAKVVAWYDNEWGYSVRVVDLIEYMADKGI
ncbi:type I glyceraldehyde-3-phosphate dehydrogenase [Natranaerofaba carboxydovora]|uniref:type I glyceraldehyde-3-phosphate dehydrogenase n=1 Tax=Natranaerofaba carboxydovora TaxID=2742683 RepID=UPI001F13B1FA|nr:type I glyceraldehyde-3-phosphate dehydrogenase [Natranaerofaba carboxydovora]UMZ72656.1 Glyceraldehyde-3-phosphate dehydrogenase [Natranaerofaba carboxydovora]